MSSSHFGVHWDGPVGWLLQSGGGANALGIKGDCPFPQPRGGCEHAIDLEGAPPSKSHWGIFKQFLDDPLVQAALPLPRPPDQRGFLLGEGWDTALTILARLCTPKAPAALPLWRLFHLELKGAQGRSNIQPWIVTQFTVKDQRKLQLIAAAVPALPRTVILAGSELLPCPVQLSRIRPTLTPSDLVTLQSLPLEAIGAEIVRRYLRKEEI